MYIRKGLLILCPFLHLNLFHLLALILHGRLDLVTDAWQNVATDMPRHLLLFTYHMRALLMLSHQPHMKLSGLICIVMPPNKPELLDLMASAHLQPLTATPS
jgi:hypothetical protein